MKPAGLRTYATACGWALARAHKRTAAALSPGSGPRSRYRTGASIHRADLGLDARDHRLGLRLGRYCKEPCVDRGHAEKWHEGSPPRMWRNRVSRRAVT